MTPVGPVLPVNFNIASGIPGIILPGLGGPAGTNAANSPAYPPLPNVNGSLPPLVYACDLGAIGTTYITLQCSDGDVGCDQAKILSRALQPRDFCISGPHRTVSRRVSVLPTASATTGLRSLAVPPCDRCRAQDLPRPSGTRCSEGGGNVCDGAGNCVECVGSSQCAPSPECFEPPTCVANACVPGAASASGTPCSIGQCDGAGNCDYISEPPCNLDPSSCTKVLTLGCTNNVTTDISLLPFTLEVVPDEVIAGSSIPTVFGGIAVFGEPFLDAAQGAVPGGVTQADLVNLAATVQIRTGGTMDAPVTLTNPPLPTTCLIGGTACNPANDGASVPGSQSNTDCVPTGTFNPCQALVTIPTSTDCAPGGACDALGKLGSQCLVNGFCTTGPLPLPLASQAGSFTPAASGIVSFGWADQGTGATVLPNGAYALPAAVFTGPPQLNEIKVNASGLSVALVCTMAVDAGGPDGPTPPVPDQASPTPSSLLVSFNIQVP